MAARRRLYLIDGTAMAYRAYFAFINRPLRTSKGANVSGIFGVANSLLKLRREENPDYWAFVFDTAEPTFRHKAYADYKSTRAKMPDEMREQIPLIKDMAEALGCPLLEFPGFEADDLIGTLAVQAVATGCDVVLVTGDKDLMQLVNDHVTMYNPRRAGEEIERLDIAGVETKFGVPPDRVTDVLALMGDSSDNIPGVPGVGPKTAVALVREHGGLEDVLAATGDMKKKGLRDKLTQHADLARLSHDLAVIKTDCPVEWDPDRYRTATWTPDDARRLFQEYEFRVLMKELGPDGDGESAKADDSAAKAGEYHLVADCAQLEKLVAQWKKKPWLAVDTETTGLSIRDSELVGVSIAVKSGEAWYIPVGHDEPDANLPRDEVIALLKPILEGTKPRLIAQNARFDWQVFAKVGIDCADVSFDPMIASFAVDPGVRSHGLDALAHRRLGYTMQPITDLIGTGKKQKTFATVPVADAVFYAAEDADFAFRLYENLKGELSPAGVKKLVETVELPLESVLARMEYAGIAIDTKHLKKLARQMGRRLDELTEGIFASAGEEFNINSPQQLGHILFDVLGLTPSGRTAKKTMRSTDVAVLERLAAQHKLPELVLEFRKLGKLKSTYIDALMDLRSPATGRVHTSFQQTVATTGRLSSSDPNLQNIPVRTPEGREIRRAFVPEGDDYQLLVADYSQIELRLMAHFSEDPALVESFRLDEDIHARTAAEVFGASIDNVTDDQRRLAKTVNFGVIYGVSPYGLAQQSDMTVGEAKVFIDAYFARYAGVRSYIDKVIDETRDTGEVRTLIGRRRFLPDIKSDHRTAREFAERAAVNTPMQGSAADIIKIAMITIDKQLRGRKSRMLLQVHDELVFEAHESECDWLGGIVQDCMEGAVKLKVPLKVDIGVGPNWLESK